MGILKKFTGLKELLLKGKTVAGESAGANAMCTVFYSPSADGIFYGLGVLPFKIIPHYKDKYDGLFKDIRSDLKGLYLKEYEHIVL
jgi:peptidase E